jgi:hypothetical protein
MKLDENILPMFLLSQAGNETQKIRKIVQFLAPEDETIHSTVCCFEPGPELNFWYNLLYTTLKNRKLYFL